MTAYSLTKVSLTQRIASDTQRRPMVRLNAMKASVPMTLLAMLSGSTWPCSARPKITAMMIQPMVSSTMAEPRITWPTVRRRKFISRTTVATIFTEAIDSAVPRNSDVISRLLGSGIMASGRNSPSAKPQANGMMMPKTDAEIEARLLCLTSLRSVSMPVISRISSTPNCDIASSIAFCSLAAGNSACCTSGNSAPRSEGPSTRPAMSCPITAGWLQPQQRLRPAAGRPASAPRAER